MAHGEPFVWLTGGALAIGVAMILGLLCLVLYHGAVTFWPAGVALLEIHGRPAVMGELVAAEEFEPDESLLGSLEPEESARARDWLARHDGISRRRSVRVGNYELTGRHYLWVSEFEIVSEQRPEWALTIERLDWGRFYGAPKAFEVDGRVVAGEPQEIWNLLEREHPPARSRWKDRKRLEQDELGAVNRRIEDARVSLRAVELEHGRDSQAYRARESEVRLLEQECSAEHGRIGERIRALREENGRYVLVLETGDGIEKRLALEQIVRAVPSNRLGFGGRLSVYLDRWWEYLSDEPRSANNEGGVLPAIVGTVCMTLVMSLIVVPLGVLAALYLREYARQGLLVSAVRVAVNNLAGVPSIVFGVFGLGFFCYLIGSSIDEWLFSARLPNPTYGKGGVLWASLTLALLTLPVVIVATEEALSSVPSSMREGSYACGATKWQTIRRIVLPRAMPGIMTGMILAIARGAGEVAPLMLVGAVMMASGLLIDGTAPYLHPERSFMHLGFHIYDLGFQSQNSEAARPMVYTTTLLLIAIIVLLNAAAIRVRTRLRRRHVA